ncbi:hypothetical protein KY339_03855 [Candidatus Woesearchaeota archaeon]|nr:hypothetical protein [Candidatus Woesearchaeota archaeon]
MVGATILGAAAANLADYPDPFVKDGMFDAVIVVGDDAAAEDVVGAVDIGASLQFEMRQAVAIASGADVSISEGTEITRAGDDLNYNESFNDILSGGLDSEDLPVILADGVYTESEGDTDNDVTYEQTLDFVDTTDIFTYDEDDDGDQLAGSYIWLDDGSSDFVYIYTLEFDDAVEYDNSSCSAVADDLEDTFITIQGNDYTITDIKCTSDFQLDEITMMSGETVIWMQQGKTLTRVVEGVEHEIEVIDVNDAEDMCGVSVDGQVVWIDTGDKATINGVNIGVTQAVAVHSQLEDTDICKVNVGAAEVKLEDGQEIEFDGMEVDGSEVNIFQPAGGEWDGFNVTYYPEDEEYIPEGGSWQDPVFQNFEIAFGKVVANYETLVFESSGNDGELRFTNIDGKEVEVPIFYSDDINSTNFGEDYSTDDCAGRLLIEGDSTVDPTDSGDTCRIPVAATNLNAIEGVLFLLETTGGEMHIMEVSNIDVNDNQTDIRDVTYGRTYENIDIVPDATCNAVDLGSLGSYTLAFDDELGNVSFTPCDVNQGGADDEETEYLGNLVFLPTAFGTDAPSGPNVSFVENDDEANEMEINVTFEYDETDDENVEIRNPNLNCVGTAGCWSVGPLDESKSNNDLDIWATAWGSIITYDGEDDDDLEIKHPEEQVYANVFISPVGAEVVGAVEGDAFALSKISVGAAKLASEVAGQEMNMNMILVGGPCANPAASVVMGSPEDCLEGFEAGKAMVKLYENDGNVAMLVAGYYAEDTRRATRVVANYDSSAWGGSFTGDEIAITGTSLTDIQVSAPE